MQLFKHDLSNKYKYLIKEAALSTKYERYLTNSESEILIPTCLCPCDIKN